MTTRRSIAMGFLVALMMLASAGPGVAHEPASHQMLNPSHHNGDGNAFGHGSDTTGESKEAQVISDRFDGLNETYMFRSVASPEAKLYQWFICPSAAANPYQGDCGSSVAEDTSPTLSSPPPGAAQVASFSAPFNVGVDGSTIIKGVACIEGPPPTRAHCRQGRIDPIHMDDAATSEHPATDSGEITMPQHGAAVLNSGFTAVAFTSQSDIGQAFFCLDIGTSPGGMEDASPVTGCDPGSAADTQPDDSPGCGSVPAGADCWEVTIDPPDDEQFALAVVEQDQAGAFVSSGEGDCEGDSLVGGDGNDVGDDCQLDKIYLTSLATLPAGPPQAPSCPGFAGDPRNQIIGTPEGDELVGSPRADVICGLKGKDLIRGLGGKDILLGGPGPDRLRGGPKADLLKGGPKNDRLNGGPGRDRCRGGPGRDREVSCER
jgi:hypothetical protein